MQPFRVSFPQLVAEQAKTDRVVVLKGADGIPFKTELVPTGDWILGYLDPGTGIMVPLFTMGNAQFREVMEPDQPSAEQYLAEAIPVYVPKPGAGAGPV
jgi:hypothetical protein